MKSITLVLCVIAILGAAASTFFFFEIGNQKEQLKQQVAQGETRANDLQAKLTESTAQGEGLQKRLAALDGDLGDAKSKLTAADTRNAQLTRDVAQLKNQITAKDDAATSLNNEIGNLKRELAQAKLAASAATPEEVEGYKTNIRTLEARVKELEATRTATVGSSGAVVGGTTAAGQPAVAGIPAEVVSIGSQNAFVVLNVGSAQGVQAGQNFNITRDGATVATAQVSSVQPSYAIAQIAAGSIRGGLVKGDKAVSQ